VKRDAIRRTGEGTKIVAMVVKPLRGDSIGAKLATKATKTTKITKTNENK
jgi:hypothetical protein